MQIHRYSQVGQVAKRTQADQCKYFTYWARFCYFMVDKVLRYIVDLMIFLDLSFMTFI
jgi:hypothetical protein